MNGATRFLASRDFLLKNRTDYDTAYREFRWPELGRFNWALDWFDRYAAGNERTALWIVDEGGAEENISFAELSSRSNRVANFLRARGVRRGDAILIMLGNVAPLWEITLAAIKLGAVVSPATAMLTTEDLQDRVDRGRIRHVIADQASAEKLSALSGSFSRIVVGGPLEGWIGYADASSESPMFVPDGETSADDPLLLYFTSGTTAKPKMVLHSHASYPVGHLSTMYWIGILEGDVHWNISSPGWAKHAWSSLFAPWNAGATVFVYNLPRFDAKKILAALARYRVTTICAPPTVWRMLILEDLKAYDIALREIVAAGEPLNPEVIERVRDAWGITMRDGYGQTETTAQFGNSPGQPVKLGSMGRPLPGYRVALLDPEGRAGDDGEIVLELDPKPMGLMLGYADSAERTSAALGGTYYRTSDVASRDADGYYFYVGRGDDVFKSSDYRISPFELESALIEHDAVAEAAVVPSPDPLRLAVPKAFIVLREGYAADADTAKSIFAFMRERVAPYKRIRRIEFGELPKTISGKIRRVQLRAGEADASRPHPKEFREEDL
ncbi:MAG TPA: AMP-binding protein [Thermoanaerobaculia bacterium]|nr:AMP-binding protein [Thermoanaerobaculia bacterium]